MLKDGANTLSHNLLYLFPTHTGKSRMKTDENIEPEPADIMTWHKDIFWSMVKQNSQSDRTQLVFAQTWKALVCAVDPIMIQWPQDMWVKRWNNNYSEQVLSEGKMMTRGGRVCEKQCSARVSLLYGLSNTNIDVCDLSIGCSRWFY